MRILPLYYAITFSICSSADRNVCENFRQRHVFLINKGRLRDFPFDTQAHNCQNSRQEKQVLFYPEEQPPRRLYKYRPIEWADLWLTNVFWGVCMCVWVHSYMHILELNRISVCYRNHVDWCDLLRFASSFCWFWMSWLVSKWINNTGLDLCVCACGAGVCGGGGGGLGGCGGSTG